MSNHLQNYISELIQLQITLVDQLASKITEAGDRFTHVLMEGGKIFVTADANCQFLATYFSEQLLVRKTQNLPSLPVITLPKEGGNLLLQTLATPQDCLLILQSSSDLSLLRDALRIAKEIALPCIILTNTHSIHSSDYLSPHDLELDIETPNHPFTHTLYLTILHALIAQIDHHLFGAIALPYASHHGVDHDLADLD